MPLLGRYKIALWSLVCGLICALVVHYFWGELGYVAYQAQTEEFEANRLNYEHLEHLNGVLRQMKEDKESFEEHLILETRKVGFYRRGEQRIIIPHLNTSDPPLEVGSIAPLSSITVGGRGYGLFALVVGACLAAIGQLLERSSRPQE